MYLMLVFSINLKEDIWLIVYSSWGKEYLQYYTSELEVTLG